MISQQPLPPGQIVDKRYRVVRQLGEGGFGRTYLAEDINRFSDRCVLKEFAPQVKGASELQKAKELFEREARTLYNLQHPQIPRFREMLQISFASNEYLLLVQDYVEGDTYLQLLKSARNFTESEVLLLLSQILPVLSYIHSQGVIHRDISPDNLIRRTSDALPVLIDFGGVKQVANSAIGQFTNLSITTRIGKDGYAPEEQLRGQVYTNSDLYGLGVTCLVLLTGKNPKELYDSYNAAWRWGREINVSPKLQTVLQKMVAYRAGDRYSNADEVIQALKLPTPAPAPTPSLSPLQPASPSPAQKNINSQIRTLVVAPAAIPQAPKPQAPPPLVHQQQKAIKPIVPPIGIPKWLRKFVSAVVGMTLLVSLGIGAWGVLKARINSIASIPKSGEKPSPTITSSSSKNRTDKLLSRRKALGISEAVFNAQVNKRFYAKHPELRGRSLTAGSEDAALRQEWYEVASDLLDKLEKERL